MTEMEDYAIDWRIEGNEFVVLKDGKKFLGLPLRVPFGIMRENFFEDIEDESVMMALLVKLSTEESLAAIDSLYMDEVLPLIEKWLTALSARAIKVQDHLDPKAS